MCRSKDRTSQTSTVTDRAATRIGAYPGTFDPPTVAHLAVAEAAWRQGGLDGVVLVVSCRPLGKAPSAPSLEDRLGVLEDVAASRPWLSVRSTDRKLIAEVAQDYAAVVLGLDKWLQVVDPAWYGDSAEARDAAVASLPAVLLAPREGLTVPPSLPPSTLVLDVHERHAPVSSTLVRAGRRDWMAPEAARFDAETGAWSDPDRYRRWLTERCAGTPGSSAASLSAMPGQPDQIEG